MRWIYAVAIALTSINLTGAVYAEATISARVNGEPVYEDSVAIVAAGVDDQKEIDSIEILDELINLKLLSQAARDLGLDQERTVSLAIDLQADQTLANAYTSMISKNIKVTPQELESEYERQVQRLEKQEYRVSHILLPTEEEALVVADAIDQGAEFSELVRVYSIEAITGTGGDLGWMSYGSNTIEHSETIELLEKGETTDPLKTSFGWHIFTITDVRGAVIPSYESIREELHTIVISNKMGAHLEVLRSNAEIDVVPN